MPARFQSGLTLIESIFSIALFMIVVMGAFQAYRALQLSSRVSQDKLSALGLATSVLEKARSQSYDDVVVTPPYDMILNGQSFHIISTLVGVDDPYDALAPADAEPVDYKSLEVRVECNLCQNYSPLTLTGRFAP